MFPIPARAWPGLKGPVGNGLDNDPADVLALKRQLHGLGLYDEPAYGFTGYIDRDTELGIRALQKREGLKIDGWLEPGGETDAALGRAFAETRSLGPILQTPRAEDILRRPTLLDFKLGDGSKGPLHLAFFDASKGEGPIVLAPPTPQPPKPAPVETAPQGGQRGSASGIAVPWFSLGDQTPTEKGNLGRPGRAAAQQLARQPLLYPGYPKPEDDSPDDATPPQEGFAGTPEETEARLLERNTGLPARNGAVGQRWVQMDKQEQARWDAAKDVMADELRTILSAKRPGRASWPHTNKTTDIIVEEFTSTLKEEFPHLVGHVFHVAGGTFEGKGKRRMSEIQILDPDAPLDKKTLGSVGPDAMIAVMRDGQRYIVGGINGASTRKTDGMLTAKEEKSFRRFMNLVVDPQLAHWVEKLRSMDQDTTKTHKEARNASRVILMGMERLMIEEGIIPDVNESEK